jgi:cell division protein FtsL
MRLITALAVMVALTSAFLLYALNYDTRRLETELAARERAGDQARADIATLRAERAYLTRPERIEPLARALGLRPITEKQLVAPAALGRSRAADAGAVR